MAYRRGREEDPPARKGRGGHPPIRNTRSSLTACRRWRGGRGILRAAMGAPCARPAGGRGRGNTQSSEASYRKTKSERGGKQEKTGRQDRGENTAHRPQQGGRGRAPEEQARRILDSIVNSPSGGGAPSGPALAPHRQHDQNTPGYRGRRSIGRGECGGRIGRGETGGQGRSNPPPPHTQKARPETGATQGHGEQTETEAEEEEDDN